ncbi:MAG: M48 family metallopeptidase [Pirellulales bacterium]|nr:M48 family metallopeptidase [Pirellulales bacterium]
MDFFEQQEVARRRTGRLIVYFAMAVVAIIVAIYFVVLLAMMSLEGYTDRSSPSSSYNHRDYSNRYGGSGYSRSYGGTDYSAPTTRPVETNRYSQSFWHPQLALVVAAATVGLILLASLYKTSQLASGGETVALMMGGRLIDSQTRDLAERRLLNVVEEMALASGTPVPPVYVMDAEPSINAFAAGHEPGDAVIGVSRGCLEYLNRDELQGVMAHEFSHILNGDMRLNLRLIGVLFGILAIAMIGWFVLRVMPYSSRSRNDKGGGIILLIMAVGVGLLIIGSVGLFFGKLIKSAVSRQREYLADASAVQFTRMPGGIAGALKKIGGRPETSRIKDAHAEEISHMFFCSAFGSHNRQFFATHPPLVDRIKRIEPTFDGEFPKVVPPVQVTSQSLAAESKSRPKPGQPLDALLPGGATTAMDPTGVLNKIGLPNMAGILLAASILESMPEPLRDAAHEPYGARAVIYAILLDRDAPMRQRQLDALQPKAEEQSFRETQRMAPLVDSLASRARLPLVETTFPALRKLSPEQYGRFRQNVELLIRADDKVDVLEYTVHTMLLRHLDVHFGLAKPPSARYRRLDPLLPSIVTVLSCLAYAGQTDEADIQRAFDKGMAELDRQASLLPRSESGLGPFEKALKTLAEATPALKRPLLTACIACVAADAQVTPREAELVQAVAANLGVPIPPLVAPPEEEPVGSGR